MIRKSLGELQWLEFELLLTFTKLKHAVFLRHGGHSLGAFSSLNLSTSMGDNSLHVNANIAKAKAALSIEKLAFAYQVHSDGVALVDNSNYATLTPHDALMTQQLNIGLKISHADCQAAIFYDPIHHALATVHCGWRGHVCNIYSKTVEAMGRTFNSKPADLHVAIAPSLGPKNAEFINYRTEFPESFRQFRLSNDRFDLWALAIWQLNQAKVITSHIQISEICTFANSADCFSYRRSNTITGAHGTIATLL